MTTVKLSNEDLIKLIHLIKKQTVISNITSEGESKPSFCLLLPFVLLLGFSIMAIVFMVLGHQEIDMPTTDDYDKAEEQRRKSEIEETKIDDGCIVIVIGLCLIIPVIVSIIYLIVR